MDNDTTRGPFEAEVDPRPQHHNPLLELYRLARLPDPKTIAPRPWLFGRLMLRGMLTVLAAPGGVGKSSLAIAIAIALATGRPLLGDRVHKPVKVLYLALEDPEEEVDRLIAAVCLHHGIDQAELEGRLFVRIGREAPLTVAAMSDGGVVYPDEDSLTAACLAYDIGAIMVDPWVSANEITENDNTQVNAAARAWLRVAEKTRAAILAPHHTRKGAFAGDVDSVRGGGALVNAARAVYTLSPMSEAAAKKHDIPEHERTSYLQLDRGKANLTADRKGQWFHLVSVNLGNATEEYPEGDDVQAVESWKPPSIFEKPKEPGDIPSKLSDDEIDSILREIDHGLDIGHYTASRRGGGARWVGHILVRQHGFTEERAWQIIYQWGKSGLLYTETNWDPRTRKEVKCLKVNFTLRWKA